MMVKRNPAWWVAEFSRAELPVLERTVSELALIRADADRVSTQHISDVVMHDPFMTFKVLRYIQQRRRKSQRVDVTTIAHSLMMLGMNPFLEHFCDQTTLQSRMQNDPQALEGALAVISRARHAAMYARDWAVVRHDLEIDEVTTAALLHDLAELLLWCYAPNHALRMQDMQRELHMRSDAVQREVLGFPLIELQVELAHKWQLPDLICDLMDERHAPTPRSLNVSLAVALARHSAHGWDDPALPDDYAGISRIIGLSPEASRDRVVKVAVKAAADGEWYGVPPAAALLPALSVVPFEAQPAAAALGTARAGPVNASEGNQGFPPRPPSLNPPPPYPSP
jgi:HD-like signal output (HDOD) protein